MLHQGSEWVALDTPLTLKELSTPDTPLSGYLKLYAKTTGLFYKGDDGSEIGPLGTVMGSGASGRVAFWSGASTLSSDADMTFATDTLTVAKIIASSQFTLSTLTQGSIPFAGASGLFSQDNATLFWDNTNKNLGIGRTSVVQLLAGRRYLTIEGASLSGGVELATGQADADGNGLGIVQMVDKNSGLADKRRAAISATLKGSTANNRGAQLGLFISANNATGLVETLRLQNDSSVHLGDVQTTPVSLHPSITSNYVQIYRNSTSVAGSLQLADNATADTSTVGELDFGTIGTAGSDKRAAVIVATLLASGVTNLTAALRFITNNAGTPGERLRIGNVGQIGIGGATYGSAGNYLRSAGSAASVLWSTLVLPNTATVNRIPFASATDTWSDSADLTYDGTDLGIGSGKRFRMQSQNRIRYLNSMANAYRITSDQTLSNNTNTIVEFNAEQFDTDTIHDNSTNPGRLTAKLAGKYLVSCSIRWEGNATGTRSVGLRKNGTTFISANGSKDVEGNHVIVTGSPVIIDLAANDYVEVIAFQDSGGDLDIIVDTRTTISMAYVGE